jgi:hypothetical protein
LVLVLSVLVSARHRQAIAAPPAEPELLLRPSGVSYAFSLTCLSRAQHSLTRPDAIFASQINISYY